MLAFSDVDNAILLQVSLGLKSTEPISLPLRQALIIWETAARGIMATVEDVIIHPRAWISPGKAYPSISISSPAVREVTNW